MTCAALQLSLLSYRPCHVEAEPDDQAKTAYLRQAVAGEYNGVFEKEAALGEDLEEVRAHPRDPA